eukprot:CAMPEP_0184454936 /NCGR_PEP_ID=MMETSP0740-20130409/21934_1 /TAXON_ID=385413 /ORGANISM="Thalassiosira miniscula, Strain CCMP1093" /LENGTH=202 /DNA_ID=CAMNT_0026826637 /DNA_START=23 /DNA_END=631 /DNA_ORIENTATION=-
MELEHENLEKDNMRLETFAKDKEENYKHLLEEKIRLERVSRDLQHELDCVTEEYDMVKGRLMLVGEMTDALEAAIDEKKHAQIERDDAINRYDIMREERAQLHQARESMSRALNAAQAEKEDVLARYNELTREHAVLQSKIDSKSHLAEMATRERERMTGMVEKYKEGMQDLKRKNLVLQDERNSLKEELICVLETASVYQD